MAYKNDNSSRSKWFSGRLKIAACFQTAWNPKTQKIKDKS